MESTIYIYTYTSISYIYIYLRYIFDISLDCNRLEWKIAVAGDIGQTGRLLVDVPARRMPVLAHEHGTAERVFSPSECTKNIGFLWVYMFTARIFKEVTGFRLPEWPECLHLRVNITGESHD